MKYYREYIVFLFTVVLFSSCLKDQKELFDFPSDERVGIYISNLENILIESSNGWLMEYFPNPESEGYSLLMKFNSDKSVMVAGLNQWSDYEYTTDLSMWDLIRDDNPVLTFNSYNKVFHIFSNPEDPSGTSSLNGIGLDGDYEFNIISYSVNEVILKGKKHNAIITLSRLDSSDWCTILTERNNMFNVLFSPVIQNLSLNYDGKQIYSLINPVNKFFTVENVDLSVPFIVTESGIKLYSYIKIEDSEIRTFNLSEDKDELVCLENPLITITGENSVDFLFDYDNWKSREWQFVEFGGIFDDLYKNIIDQCKDVFNEDFKSLKLRYSGERSGVSLVFESGEYFGNIDLSLSNNGFVSLKSLGTSDLNGTIYLNKISCLNDFITKINNTKFFLDGISGLNPTVINMYDSLDENNYMRIKLTDL